MEGGICGRGGMREVGDDGADFQERTWPAMDEEQGDGICTGRTMMHEVELDWVRKIGKGPCGYRCGELFISKVRGEKISHYYWLANSSD